jgi:glycerol-3-phosphate dehydrogenase
MRDGSGRVAGIALRDGGPDGGGRIAEIPVQVVIDATGAAADRLQGGVGGEPRIRPLPGSRLFFPAHRFPLALAVGSSHPADGRPVFAYPWDGVTIVGTTDGLAVCPDRRPDDGQRRSAQARPAATSSARFRPLMRIKSS